MSKVEKCLIVDDHPIVRKGVRDLLLQEGVCAMVGEAADAGTALAQVKQQPWDLLILDVALPDQHGLEILKQVKLLRPDLPVIMLSLYPEQEFALRALRSGAAGYVTKDRSPAELLTAIRTVTAGHRYVTDSLGDQLTSFRDRGQLEDPHHALSDREMEVLRLLGQGLTVSAIAEQLTLSVKTVSTYRSRLLDKLRLQSTADLVRYAIQHHLAV